MGKKLSYRKRFRKNGWRGNELTYASSSAFLVELLLFGAVALIYLFYFNRIFAWLVSLAIRSISKRLFHVYISIEAIQISILGGRIFFKGFKYHGQNETVLIIDGFVTWRYWLRRVQENDLGLCKGANGKRPEEEEPNTPPRLQRHGLDEQNENSPRVTRHQLPCRILLEARGLEWFMYNRSPAYDAILAEFSKPKNARNTEKGDGAKKAKMSWDDSTSVPQEKNHIPTRTNEPSEKLERTSHSQETLSLEDITGNESAKDGGKLQSLPRWLCLLPVGISCEKGAIILGNENTKCHLVIKFDRAKGQVGVSPSRESDLYRQTFDIEAEHFVIQLRPNKDYVESQMVHGARGGSPTKEPEASNSRRDTHRRSKSTWRDFHPNWIYRIPFLGRSSDSVLLDSVHGAAGARNKALSWNRQENQVWHGLSRYLDDEDELLVEQERWKAIEYAALQNLVDFPTVGVSLHWDVPGLVTERDVVRRQSQAENAGNINGATPPDWEITLRIGGGTINYGPWADRNREDIQNLFFPSGFMDATRAAPLQVGQLRISTSLKLRVEIEKQTIFRIPTREESKDWRWKGKAGYGPPKAGKKFARRQTSRAKKTPVTTPTFETRPPGWLEMVVAPDSCVTYETDLVASSKGYRSKLDLEFKTPQMSTSVNHDLIWRSLGLAISCDLSVPLRWSDFRHWRFDVLGESMEIFLLRDHVFLLTDLINDWTGGPQALYHTFVPFTYDIKLRLPHYKIFLYANDSNIIDDPSNTDEMNSVIVLRGPLGIIDVNLPFNDYRPLRNTVSFGVDATDVRVQLNAPSWNTYKTFLATTEVGSIKHALIHGSYDFFTTTSPSFTDTVIVHVDVEQLFLKPHGFLIRRFMNLKDNYFGEDYHFQTLDEYQAKINRADDPEHARNEEARNARITNDLDVVVAVKLDETTLALPCNIYSAQKVIKVEFPSLELDLRFTNYYMDIEVILSPLSLSSAVTRLGGMDFEDSAAGTEMFIDGFRIAGHRLFGLPPAEPTYVCNWDLGVGSISGECSAAFLKELLFALRCIAFSFEDRENALPLVKPTTIHDLTFLRTKVDSIKVWVPFESTAILVQTNAIELQFNDWANPRFSDHLQANITGIRIASTDTMSASQRRSGVENKTTYAYLETSLKVRVASAKPHSEIDRELQQKHVELHDSRTRRVGWLLHKQDGESELQGTQQVPKIRVPAMPFPPMPQPTYKISDQRTSSRLASSPSQSSSSVRKRPSLRSKNSFLSASIKQVSRHSSESRAGPVNKSLRTHPYSFELSSSTTKATLRHGRPRLSPTTSRPSVVSDNGRSRTLPGQNSQSVSGVLFTSPYQRPHFPLFNITPDTRDVPKIDLPATAFEETSEVTDLGEDFLSSRDPALHYAYVSVSLTSEVRFLMTPDGLRNFQVLALSLQPDNPAAILDDLQMQAFSIETTKEQDTPVRSVKVRIQVPSVALTFIDEIKADRDSVHRRHIYDFHLAGFVSILGITDHPDQKTDASGGHKGLIHATWKELSLAARVESQDDARGLVNLSIAFLVGKLSLAVDPGMTGDLSFQDLEVACINRRVTYLSSLLQTTTAQVDKLLRELQKLKTNRTRFFESFIFSLLDCKDPPRDPAFLTSASYVLRSAAGHVRLSDSWKMIARLRQIQLFRPLPNGSLHEDQDRQDGAPFRPPSKDLMCHKFLEWRGWDLNDPKSSTFIHVIYEPTALPISRETVSISDSIRLSIESQNIRLLVNPGPEQNEVAIMNLTICFISTNSEPSTSASYSGPTTNPRDHTLEVLVGAAKARLNWDIFQLVDDMNRQFFAVHQADTTKPSHKISPSNLLTYHRCHVLLLSGTNTLELASINLQYSSTAKNFKSSLIMDYMAGRDLLIFGDLHVKQLVTGVSSSSKLLLSSQVLEPSVHVMFEQIPTSLAKENLLTVAAFCKDLSLRSQQDVHGILTVLDFIIGDELQHLQIILQGFKRDVNPSKPSVKTNNAVNNVWMFQTAFSLNNYQIGILLLPSLEYVIQGGLARSTLRPKEYHSAKLKFDFDLEEHSQALVSINDDDQQRVFTLILPPINGSLDFVSKKSIPKLTACIVIETVQLDAASLYHAISASLQSDLMTLRESVWRDFETVRARFMSAIEPSEKSKFPVTNFSPDRSSLLFEAHVAIAGLDIRASSVKHDEESSHLHFHLACITLGLSNQDQSSQRALEFLEGNVNLTEVKLRMEHTVGARSFPSGDLAFTASLHISSQLNNDNELVRYFEASISSIHVELYTGTASLLVDILAHLRQRLQKLDLTEEIRGLRARQRIRGRLKTLPSLGQPESTPDDEDSLAIGLFTSMFLFEVNDVQISWNVGDQIPIKSTHEREDLVLSISKIELATRRENAARLMFRDFQVQLVPTSQSKALRSANSALLPKVTFNVAYFSTPKERRLAFQSTGQSLDLRLTSNFILPANDVQRSVAIASQELRDVITSWNAPQFQSGGQMTNVVGSKRLSSLLVDADFAGAVVYIQSQALADSRSQSTNGLRNGHSSQQGRYDQSVSEKSGSSMVMRSPGIAWKVEYGNTGIEDPTLSAEIKIDASENTLHPAVVPLLVEMSSSIREIVGKSDDSLPSPGSKASPPKSHAEDKFSNADPTAILGSCKLNLGLTICRQEFSLTCQPIARVAATAKFERINLTINTVQAEDTRFFAVFMACKQLNASVQHIYSRESTGTFEVESIVLSLMNSKHVSSTDGISAIARFTPVKVTVNAKQVHDFLLFREIWIPAEMRAPNPNPDVTGQPEPQTIIVQRYQQMAATGAFPWNASVSIAELNVGIDFGPILGKSTLSISELWVCSKKSSDWEQSLCLGLDNIIASSVGRMSGSIDLSDLRVRTSIRWPAQGEVAKQTPVVEASSHFNALSMKVAFDYQAFLIASVTDFDFLMFNVRGDQDIDGGDRLVGVLNLDKLQVFCTTSSASHGLALYQAVERLVQEKQTAYMNSLREIEKHLRRKSSVSPLLARVAAKQESKQRESPLHTPIRLHTDVTVSIHSINMGAFPGTFFDTQLFKLETFDTSAQFSVSIDQGKVHSNLGLQLGLLRIALSGVTRPALPKSLDEVSVAEVVQLAISSRGGTILKVPRVVADMQTWQAPASNEIDYLFRSSFEGKVEVGWNYSRISFLRGMWANHTRTLAHRLGKPLPQSAVQITGGPQPPGSSGSDKPAQEQEKITAVVNVPLSKYHYTALETPIIETPQLRDMGEATPPLEWIGLHRERLPNLTHQIVIVTLLEVAKEVEDAYTQILGS